MIYRAPFLAGLALIALEAPLLAQPDVVDQIAVCARIGKKDARLACYDSVAQAAARPAQRADSGSQPSPPPAPSASTDDAKPQGLGAEQVTRRTRDVAESTAPTESETTVIASRDIGRGLWQFQMADGAIWRMTERVAGFRPPSSNGTVSVRRGALGSYMMKVGRQGAVRVMRVK